LKRVYQIYFYKMTTVQVIRHDARMDTDAVERANVDRTYDTPLSTAGVAHAAAAAGRPGDLIVSSPLYRCIQTALPWLNGPLILDARFMEVYHPKVIVPIQDFKFRTEEELPPAFYIRTAHGIPAKVETRGINGDADQRYRAAIQDYAEKAHRAGIKHVQIFTHGDCIGSFAAMFGKEVYSTEYGCSIRGIYNGTWTFDRSNDVGIHDL
jgi:broad specificity phosphatase PhoE